ncbi:GntR family transcriptional regulator [Amycolatopsis sp. NPDC059021]|uniref:GntR family transcriptional regulator n=1 Tax=Amycolatopsis sp. NPDC059021 TaxID=3346704 RepID=UPI0036707B43
MAGTAREPLWQRIQNAVLERLRAGEFAERFPGELELVAEYGVSRTTVRRALTQLRADGVVSAERGKRPRLHPARDVEQPLGSLYSLHATVRTTERSQRSVVRRLDVHADGVIADHLGLDGSAPLVHVERLRLAGEEPLALDRVWLPADRASCLLDADLTHTGVYAVLARCANLRLDRGRETIRAVVLTPADCATLGCAPGSAGLSIHRLSHAKGVPLEWRHTLVRGDRFTLTATFTGAAGS